MRYAAIDIGSNAVRLLIADIIDKGDEIIYTKNTLLRVPLRLGDDAFIDKHISQGKFDDMVKTMGAFKSLMDVYKVSDYMAVATSAMRDSDNGTEIVKECKKIGVDIQIVDGSIEAQIIHNSHLSDSFDKNNVYLYIDVGGGSTELSLFVNGELVTSRSFNLGTIRILDKQDLPATWDDLKSWVHETTKSYKDITGIGTGGNINKLSRMANLKDSMPISFEKLTAIHTYLSSISLKDRIEKLRMRSDRADVIIPAADIFLTIMEVGQLNSIVAPHVGLVDGIIQTLIDKNLKK